MLDRIVDTVHHIWNALLIAGCLGIVAFALGVVS